MGDSKFRKSMQTILITGGAGFIGVNLASHFLKQKNSKIIIFDNLSRLGAQGNLKWIKQNAPANSLEFVKANLKNYQKLKNCVKRSDKILHMAAQVAVTLSVKNPREDFESNCLGTFNLLEAMRETKSQAPMIYASTNKVYGDMEELKIKKLKYRYAYQDYAQGITEQRQLDFHSPYGCSKGAADQYVRDYSRIYGLNTIIFRQSCIYGPRQMGHEDQGWVAWFAIASLLKKRLTVYGDGKQVRDVLYIDDLVRAMEMAISKIQKIKGRIYNIGGGPKNTMSLLELIGYLEKFLGRKIKYGFDDWRPGDQKVYVSNIQKAQKEFGWEPKIVPKQGVENLVRWVKDNQKLF